MPHRHALPTLLPIAAVVLGVLTAPLSPLVDDANACSYRRDVFSEQRHALHAYSVERGVTMTPVGWCADATQDAVCISSSWRGNGGEWWTADLQLQRWNINDWKVTGESAARQQTR